MATIMLVLVIFWEGVQQEPLMMEERYETGEACTLAALAIGQKLVQHSQVTRVGFRCVESETS